MTIEGTKKASDRLAGIGKKLARRLSKTNIKNAEEIADVARILVPLGTKDEQARTRSQITTEVVPDSKGGGTDAVMIDFGPRAKVVEGNKGPTPFVNPALEVTRNRRRARIRRAIKAASREDG